MFTKFFIEYNLFVFFEEPDSCIIDSWAQGVVQYAVVEEENKNYENHDTGELSSARVQAVADVGPSTYEFLQTLNKFDPSTTTASSENEKSKNKNTKLVQQERSKVKTKFENTKAPKQSSDSSKKNLERMKVSNSSNINSQTISNNDATISMVSRSKSTSNKTDNNKQAGKQKERDDLLDFDEETDREPYDLNETDFKENKSVTSSEVRRLEEPISKAPLACQSLLKVRSFFF
jgi:hypothetical protein